MRRGYAATPDEEPERFDARVTGRLATRDPVAGEDDRRLGLLDELERPLNDRVLRFRIRRPPHFQRLHVDVLAGDVFGKLDMRRARFLETRDAKGLAHDLRRRLADADARTPFRDRAEHADDVDVLVRFLMGAFEADLARDRDERSAVDLRVGDSGDEIGRAGPERGKADTGIRRETTVH